MPNNRQQKLPPVDERPLLIVATGSSLNGLDGIFRGLTSLLEILCGEPLPPRSAASIDARREIQIAASKRLPLNDRELAQVVLGCGVDSQWLGALVSAHVLSFAVLGRERR